MSNRSVPDRDTVPHEHKNHDVDFKKDPKHRAIPYLKALLAHQPHPTPERVAEILDQHETKLDDVVHFLHEHFGNGFVDRVMAAHRKLAKHSHNEHMDDLNAAGDFGWNRPHTKQTDPNRLTDGGKTGKIATKTAIYKGDGTTFDRNTVQTETAAESGTPAPAAAEAASIVEVEAGADVRLNAGGFAMLTIDGAPQACVMAFYLGNAGAQVTGFVPVSALTPESRPLVEKDQAITDKLAAKGAKEHYRTTARHVVPAKPDAELDELRTEPGMKDEGVSRVHHYCERPGGVVNLLVNVPGSDDSRFGVAVDILTPATQFFASTTVAPQHTPLYRFGAGKGQTNKQLTFVYGKAVTGTRTTYGWINKAMLG
jgi:hypothetical protein